MKKPIKIIPDNFERLRTEIDAVQSRARVRRLTPEGIARACNIAFQRLGISKKACEGVQIDVDEHAQTFPGAYRGLPESTHFRAIYKRGAWYLTDVRRAPVRCTTAAVVITLTDAAKQAILSNKTTFSI